MDHLPIRGAPNLMGDVIAFRGKRRAPPAETTYGASDFWAQRHIPMPPLLAYGRDAGSIGDEPRVPLHHLDNIAKISANQIGNSITFGPTGATTVNGGVKEFTPYSWDPSLDAADLIQFAKSGAPPARPLE
jgi:hypothetical protein